MRLDAKFITSAFAPAQYPRWDRREVALAGRSNVGKSSIINALTQRKNLARTSRTPGRTRSLNFFALEDDVALVDLPGFGYAKMARAEASRIATLMNHYLSRRHNLAALVMLVDSRRGPEREEMELAALAAARELPLMAVATKCDKLRRADRASALARFASLGVTPFLCSALIGEGIEELSRQILKHAAHRPIASDASGTGSEVDADS
jgi:GTP-binding protein